MTGSRVASLLALGMVLAAGLVADREARAADTYNIYTFNGQVRFGDLASNWHVALYLRHANPDARINFFLSHDFANPVNQNELARFKIMVPEFIPNRIEQVIEAHDIYVYTGFDPNGEYPPPAESILRNAALTEIASSGDDVCNLAFTAQANAPFPHTLPMDVLAASDNPLLIWDWPIHNSRTRLILNETNVNMANGIRFVNDLQRIPAIYLFHTNFFTRTLFTTREPGNMVPGELTPLANFRGLAYARTTNYVRGYIELVRQQAVLNPEHTYAVTVVGQHELNLDTDVFERTVVEAGTTPSGSIPLVIPPGLGIDGMSSSQLPELWRSGNLTVYHYSRASHLDSVRLTKGANLPVLVSGSLSLAHALQYAKPFIYEPAFHLLPATPPIGDHVVHSQNEIDADQQLHDDYQAQVAACNAEADPDTRTQCLTGLGEPRVPVSNALCASPEVYILPDDTVPYDQQTANLDTHRSARLQCLFGVFETNGELRFSSLLRERNEARFRHKLASYRQQRPTGMPAGHLLDFIPTYCERARQTTNEINRQCLQQENKALCIRQQLESINWPDELH